MSFKDPLVSIIIVNWNYGRFVGQAIASARAQTYTNFECVVVDNASTDDSVAVISQAIADDDRFRLHRRSENCGHLGGVLAALAIVSGDFIVFLDADDILFDTFLHSHVQVHLATTLPSSFTTSNFITIDHDHVVKSGRSGLIDATCAALQPSLSPTTSYLSAGMKEDHYRALQQVTFYAPADIGKWCWAPGSANMLRREVVALLQPDVSRAIPFGGADAFFLLPMFAMTGINMINVPLSAYRIHGANDHAKSAHLRGLVVANEQANVQNSAVKRLALLTMISRCEQLSMIAGQRYFRILDMVERNSRDSLHLPRSRAFSSEDVKAAIAIKYPLLAKFFGERTVLRELRRLMGMSDVASILWMAFDRLIPFATLRRFAETEIWRAGHGRIRDAGG